MLMLKVQNTEHRNYVSQSSRRSRRQKERVKYINLIMNPGQRAKGSILRQKVWKKRSVEQGLDGQISQNMC